LSESGLNGSSSFNDPPCPAVRGGLLLSPTPAKSA
jgi:hypothetical protein